MNEPLPIWRDESSAGSLFPNARPIPTRHIVQASYAGDQSVMAVDAFREREQTDRARREAQREREQSPEAQEAEWRAAREEARAEMRRERRQERVAAGIETQTAPDWIGLCTEWVDEVARGLSAPDDAPHKSLAQTCSDLAAINANGGWLPPPRRTAPAKPPKARPDRERYLPGTRHAGKGGRR